MVAAGDGCKYCNGLQTIEIVALTILKGVSKQKNMEIL